MDSVENSIKMLLDGQSSEEPDEFCDFSLNDQNELSASKGVSPSVPADFTPLLRDSVCYIVAAVLIDDQNRVLMMQEAKSRCAGQWYLPAGRMEQGETIEEAAKREVLEETGLEFDVSTLLMVESASGSWYRFVVTGHVVGGTLKTPASADQESLQAMWVEDVSELSLRGNDIHPLIERAKEYKQRTKDEPWHPVFHPIDRSHSKILLKLAIVIRRKSNNRVCILMSDKTATHLPTTEVYPVRSLHSTMRKYMTEIFGSDLPPHRPQGVLSVELRTGIPEEQKDGLSLTILVPIRKALEEVPLIDKYSWIELSKPVGEDLISRMGKNMIIPLNVIR